MTDSQRPDLPGAPTPGEPEGAGAPDEPEPQGAGAPEPLLGADPQADDVDAWGNPHGVIPRALIDPDAVKILRRLKRHGFTAYLVGGGVRDLLLGRTPKDFDVATSARPEEVKRLFRNCRIIGRRFRLAHVFFRDKIIEVSTFRALVDPVGESEGQDLLIRSDNVFGTAEQDAVRRDFTINGLFYDVEQGEVIDYVGGREDLARRVVRTIGDPDIRFREDPIRMLRAIKFAARLGFALDDATDAALRRHRRDVLRSAPPRVLEEVLRLLGGGAARASLRLLAETGTLGVLLPEIQNLFGLAREGNPVARYLWDAVEAHLAAVDSLDRGRRGVPNCVLAGALAMPLLFDRPEGLPAWAPPAGLVVAGPGDEEEEDGAGDESVRRGRGRDRRRRGPAHHRHGGIVGEVDGVASALALRMNLPRRDAAALRGALLGVWRMLTPVDPRREVAVARRPFFAEALVLLRLRDLAAGGAHADEVARWEDVAAAVPPRAEAPPGEERGRRRRRGRRGGAEEAPPGRRRRGAGDEQPPLRQPRDPEAEWAARRSAAAEAPIPTLLIGGPAAARAGAEPGSFGAGVGGDDDRQGRPGRGKRRRRRGRRRRDGD